MELRKKLSLFLKEKDMYFAKDKFIDSRSDILEPPEENLFPLLQLFTVSLKMELSKTLFQCSSSFNVYAGDFDDRQ